MARPAKSLDAHVREGTFRARRDTHRQLLTGPPLQWPALASLLARYQQTRSEPERSRGVNERPASSRIPVVSK